MDMNIIKTDKYVKGALRRNNNVKKPVIILKQDENHELLVKVWLYCLKRVRIYSFFK